MMFVTNNLNFLGELVSSLDFQANLNDGNGICTLNDKKKTVSNNSVSLKVIGSIKVMVYEKLYY